VKLARPFPRSELHGERCGFAPSLRQLHSPNRARCTCPEAHSACYRRSSVSNPVVLEYGPQSCSSVGTYTSLSSCLPKWIAKVGFGGVDDELRRHKWAPLCPLHRGLGQRGPHPPNARRPGRGVAGCCPPLPWAPTNIGSLRTAQTAHNSLTQPTAVTPGSQPAPRCWTGLDLGYYFLRRGNGLRLATSTRYRAGRRCA
jgi:hypothetical protein